MRIISASHTTPVDGGTPSLSLTYVDDNGITHLPTFSQSYDGYNRLFEAVKAYFSDPETMQETHLKTIDDLLHPKNHLADTVREAVTRFTRTIDSDTSMIFTVGDDGFLYANGSLLPPAIGQHAMRIINKDVTSGDGFDDWKSFSKFIEKTMSALTPDVQTQLFSWLKATDGFTINREGNIIGYKSCNRNDNGDIVSINAGPGSVITTDPHTGAKTVREFSHAHLPNDPGTTVYMPRELVEHDPTIGCSRGLHVGTHNYAAHQFIGDVLVLVEVNPADIISVPYECDAQKMRVARYTVLSVTDNVNKIDDAVWSDSDDDDFYDFDEDYDEDDFDDDDDEFEEDYDDWDFLDNLDRAESDASDNEADDDTLIDDLNQDTENTSSDDDPLLDDLNDDEEKSSDDDGDDNDDFEIFEYVGDVINALIAHKRKNR